MYSAILLSGGKGTRLERDMPKQYLLLAGKPVIMHSIERLEQIKEIDEIIIVCEEEWKDKITVMLKQYDIRKKIKFAPAGRDRQESVYHGLLVAESEQVILHEAARPFAVLEDYRRLMVASGDNATLGYQIPFTVLKGKEKIEGILERTELVNIQLPQKFGKKTLLMAHEKARAEKKNFTEDASLLFYYEHADIGIVQGNSYNIKITEPVDWATAIKIYDEYIIRRK